MEQVVEAAGIGPGSRVLEIGPGTGQLTRPLLALGIRVTAVELGEALAAAGRQKLARFPDLDIVISAFEDWELPREPFDAVVAATSFHWIAPEVRAPKAAQALKPGGSCWPSIPIMFGETTPHSFVIPRLII